MNEMIDARPARFPDVGFYPGDPLVLRFFFHAIGTSTPVDVTTSTFTVRSVNAKNIDLVVPTLDLSLANQGSVRVTLTGPQTEQLPVYSNIAITESSRWNRTILLGRLVQSQQVGHGADQLAVVEDYGELVIPVTVSDPFDMNAALQAFVGSIIGGTESNESTNDKSMMSQAAGLSLVLGD